MSRCKACDVPMAGQSELCTACRKVSTVTADNWPELEETVPDGQYFMSKVYKHELDKSWREGAGFLSPEERVRHLWDRALARYLQNREWGMSQYMAFAKATGLANRGNQMFAKHGVTTGSDTDGNTGAVATVERNNYEFLY